MKTIKRAFHMKNVPPTFCWWHFEKSFSLLPAVSSTARNSWISLAKMEFTQKTIPEELLCLYVHWNIVTSNVLVAFSIMCVKILQRNQFCAMFPQRRHWLKNSVRIPLRTICKQTNFLGCDGIWRHEINKQVSMNSHRIRKQSQSLPNCKVICSVSSIRREMETWNVFTVRLLYVTPTNILFSMKWI